MACWSISTHGREGASEPLHAGMDLQWGEARIAEQERRARIGVERVQGERPDIDAVVGRFAGGHAIVQAGAQPPDQVQAALGRVYVYELLRGRA